MLISCGPTLCELQQTGYRRKGCQSIGCFEELYPNGSKLIHSDSLFWEFELGKKEQNQVVVGRPRS